MLQYSTPSEPKPTETGWIGVVLSNLSIYLFQCILLHAFRLIIALMYLFSFLLTIVLVQIVVTTTAEIPTLKTRCREMKETQPFGYILLNTRVTYLTVVISIYAHST